MNFMINSLGSTAAEIVGLDCSRPFPEETAEIIREEYKTHPVLIFRDQKMPAQALAAFGRQFGALESYGNPLLTGSTGAKGTAALHETAARQTPDQLLYQNPDDPDVLIMTNEIREELPVIGIVDNAEIWHSDASHKPKPCQAIIVHVVRNPAAGGDTEFCDLRMVYETLTPDIKRSLIGRTATHHWSKALNPRFAGTLDEAAQTEGEQIARLIPEMHQPVVRTHPETGRPSLYISPRFTLRIDDIDPAISDSFLNGFFEFMEDPTFHYRHEWRENDLMIWDNRCLNHRVRGYDANDIRCRHRVTVAGFEPYYRPTPFGET